MMLSSEVLPDAGIRQRLRGVTLALLACCMMPIWLKPSAAQPPADAFPTWKDLEASQEFKDTIAALKGGAALDDKSRSFLETSVLAQVSRDGNRAELADVRKKIRDRVLLIMNDQALAQASTLVRDRMNEAARDKRLDPLLRASAMLFIGELTDKSRIPWAPAVQTLAAAAGDVELDPAIRIAALNGLGNHLAAMARLSGGHSAAVRDAVAGMLPSLLGPPSDGNRDADESRSAAASWLASRGLSMLPQVMSPLPADIAPRLIALIDDGSWPIDVRVRAAAAVGRMAGPDSGVDAMAVVTAIEKLAIAALEADRSDARRRMEEAALRGATGQGGGLPGGQRVAAMPSAAPAAEGLGEAVCRRAAWRLYTLGDAIVPVSKKGGLVSLLDRDSAAAERLAEGLKEAGESLDAEPVGTVLLATLDALDPVGARKRSARPSPPPAEEPQPERPPEAKPVVPNEPAPSEDPFGK